MIVIHIGMPKAGSTTIQHFLRDNDAALRELSIDYPVVGREHPNFNLNHRNFANGLLERENRIHKKSSSMADLIAYISESKYNTTILSSEELFRATEPSIIRARELLSSIGQEFRLILIIRDPSDRLPSAYAQGVRFGASTDDFDTFFEFRSANDKVDQFKIAERWAKVFGWSAIRVRLLSPPALRGGDLIEDFMASAGLDPDSPELTALPRPARANESPGWKTLEAVRAFFGGRSALQQGHPLLRMDAPKTPRKRRRFGSAAEESALELGWPEDKGRYLTRAQAASCADAYALTVRQLNEYLEYTLPVPLGSTERDFVERSFLPDVTRIDPAELNSFYDAWGARLDEGRNEHKLKK